MTEKSEFLAYYDYGMGGVFCRFYARSAEEIGAKYPMLVVVEDRPAWLDDELFQKDRLASHIRCRRGSVGVACLDAQGETLSDRHRPNLR
jgi:hypothetical protein